MHLRRHVRPAVASSTLALLLFSVALFLLFRSELVCALAEDLATTPDHQLESFNVHDVLKGRSEHEALEERYEPSFIGINRGIIGRAGDEIQTLDNNQPGKPENGLQSGQTLYYVFQKDTILGPKSPSTPGLPSGLTSRGGDGPGKGSSDELRKRQSQVQIYVSLSTCSQPIPNNANTDGAAGQLQLFISTSKNNQKPDQGNHDLAISMDGGYAGTNINASDDVFFSVSAPDNNGFTGNYNYELTASIDDFYATYNDSTFNRIIDTDTYSALIYTNDTANSSSDNFQQWMETSAFSAYVFSQNNAAIIGIQNSWCALDSNKQVYANSHSTNTSTTTTLNGNAKQQFYIQGLNGSSAYYAMVAIEGNSTASGGGVVGGGGTVWKNTNFKTKSDNNCKIVYNLTFCTDVGYAVPWDASSNETSNLGFTYDNFTQTAYQWFDKSLQQVACDTTASAQYSLARTCDDCAAAYKEWLCAVTMPRCEDFSNNAWYLQPRAINSQFTASNFAANPGLKEIYQNDPDFNTPGNGNLSFMNGSRSSWIDGTIAPVPYKELLPCQDLCYHLVQSCPAVLQFACPLAGFGLNYTYGAWNSTLNATELTPDQYQCNPMTMASRATIGMGNSRLGIAMTLAAILAAVVF